jgi:hypothetical protein
MGNIISNFYRFVKILIKWLKVNIFTILLGFLMFGLGLVYGGRFLQRPPIMITGDVISLESLKEKVNINTVASVKKISTTTTTLDIKKIEPGGFIASKRGKYYYPVGCKLADSLSPANLVYFENEGKAIEAGYIRQIKCD